MSLSMTLYQLLSAGSTQVELKIVDWHVKNQNKHIFFLPILISFRQKQKVA